MNKNQQRWFLDQRYPDQLVSEDQIRREYENHVADGSIDPAEKSFQRYLFCCMGERGGTLKEAFSRIVILQYPESNWGSDLVCFYLPTYVSSTSLMEELELQLEEMQDNYDSPQDLADDLCNEVARLFNGTWSYIAQAGRIDIRV